MGGVVRGGYMAGAMAEPEPGEADSGDVWREERLKPGEGAVFAGFENGTAEGKDGPPEIGDESGVADCLKEEAEHNRNGLLV